MFETICNMLLFVCNEQKNMSKGMHICIYIEYISRLMWNKHIIMMYQMSESHLDLEVYVCLSSRSYAEKWSHTSWCFLWITICSET